MGSGTWHNFARVLAVTGLALVAVGCSGGSKPSSGDPANLARAVSNRDAAAAVAALGPPHDEVDAQTAADALAQLPEGTKLVLIGDSKVVAESAGLRVVQSRYEVRVPGEQAKSLIVERWSVLKDGAWTEVSDLVVDGAQ